MSDGQETPEKTQQQSVQAYHPIADVTVTLRAELDRRVIKIRELMRFDVDTVLPLTRPAGENIDLYVGEVLIGTGEILVVDGTLALRVADLKDKSAANKRDTVAKKKAEDA